ncbi:MAG: DUF4065 domain-containing protein [Ignavibacteriae bacterium]|nr:DUF4065 domain-containing protein [Ignavibacteriota bacterium]
MNKIKLNSKKLLLLLLYSSGKTSEICEEIKGRTRIVKMIFLFNEEIKKDFIKDANIEMEPITFYSWDYGPFSKDIYNDIEFFINNNLIIVRNNSLEKEEIELFEYERWLEDQYMSNEVVNLSEKYNQEIFQLSQKGKDWIEKNIWHLLSQNQIEILKLFKKRLNEASLDAILRYTYLKFPNYTDQSKIKEKIIGF